VSAWIDFGLLRVRSGLIFGFSLFIIHHSSPLSPVLSLSSLSLSLSLSLSPLPPQSSQ